MNMVMENIKGGPKYSILIPTRNGISYLPFAVQSVLNQSNENFELVISDNHSNDGTSEYLATLKDSRVKVTMPGKSLSMPAHYEFILSQAQGEWITILGDDDALMPDFFAELEQLNLDKTDVEALVSRRAYYFWPGCEELYGDVVVAYQGRSKRTMKHSVANLFLSLCSVTAYTEMPQAYTTGLIRKTLIDRIKLECHGRFYFATSPDVYSAIAIACRTKKYLRLEKPLFWVGTSAKSVGFSGAGKAKERYKEFWQQCAEDGFHITSAIPMNLFILRDGALFTYDALLNSPLPAPFWKSVFVKYFVYAGVARKNSDLKMKVKEELGSELNTFVLSCCSLLLFLIDSVYKINSKRLGLIDRFVSKKIISSDRGRFSSIGKASDELSRL